MTSLTDRLKAKVAFDEIGDVSAQAYIAFAQTIPGGSTMQLSLAFQAGEEAENARLQPILTALIAVVRIAEDANAQIKDQGGMWPAEVDSLDEALKNLTALVEETSHE